MKLTFLGQRRVQNGGPIKQWDKKLGKSVSTGRIRMVIEIHPDVVAALEIKPGDVVGVGQIVNLGYMPPKRNAEGLKRYHQRRKIEKQLKDNVQL